jgi:hypothetical protein
MTWWQIVLGGLGLLILVAVAAFIGSLVAALALGGAIYLHDRLQKLAKNKGGR